jgi:hypothetical protein
LIEIDQVLDETVGVSSAIREVDHYHLEPVFYKGIIAMLFLKLYKICKVGVAFPAKPMVCPCVRLRDIVATYCPHDLLL